MISEIMSNEIVFSHISAEDTTEILNILIEETEKYSTKEAGLIDIPYINTHGLQIYKFLCTKGVHRVGLSHAYTQVSLLSGLKKMVIPTQPPAVYVIENIDIYVMENTLPDVIEILQDLFIKFKGQNKKLVLIGKWGKLPKYIQDLFFPIDLSKEVKLHRISSINISTKKTKTPFLEAAINNFITLSPPQLANLFKGIALYNLRTNKEILKFKAQLIEGGLLEYISENTTTFADIGGLSEIKEWIINMRKIRGLRIPSPRSILLTGRSGCGKTIMGKAIANYLNTPLYRVDMGRLYDKYLGNTEEKVRTLWKEIEAVSPATILFDEIEKMLAGSSSSNESDAGTTARVMSYMLYQFQEQKTRSFIVGTVNNISALPEEFFRLGRWDEVFNLSPTAEGQREVVKVVLKKYEIDFTKKQAEILAELLPLSCGAYLEKHIYTALMFLYGKGTENIKAQEIIKYFKGENNETH